MNEDLKESSRVFYILFNKWRKNDIIRTVMTAFGLIVAVINFEYDTVTYKEAIDIKKYPNAMDHPRNKDMFGIVCKMLSLFLTIMSFSYSI